MVGKVYLVGAGPGDPGLLTLKAKACLEQADIVIYDHLANAELLAYLRPQAERVYVGKQAGQHTLKQEAINTLLVESARKYACVVRLKGGDPFVFGRGGEEILEFVKQEIPFEVVPGIPAGIGATAYAGIPVTHRGLATSVAFITGHEAEKSDESASVNWELIAKSCDTLVLYMGVKNLGQITDKLLAAGLSADTPAAIIREGTYPSQVTVTGTVATIACLAAERQITPPAITVIGQVVNLREQLAWFEDRPLFGKTVVVTRNLAAENTLTQLLAEAGAQVVCFPTIEIAPITPNPQLDESFRRLTSYQWLILTSGNAVEIFFDRLFQAGYDARALSAMKIAVIGKPTAEKLGTYHLRPDLLPETFTSERLVDAILAQGALTGQCVLFPGSTLSNPDIAERLQQAGATVDVIPVYETRIAQQTPESIQDFQSRIVAKMIDWITFTSSSTVENFVELVGKDFLSTHAHDLRAASIGPMTTVTLEKYGILPRVRSVEHTFQGLVAALIQAEEINS